MYLASSLVTNTTLKVCAACVLVDWFHCALTQRAYILTRTPALFHRLSLYLADPLSPVPRYWSFTPTASVLRARPPSPTHSAPTRVCVHLTLMTMSCWTRELRQSRICCAVRTSLIIASVLLGVSWLRVRCLCMRECVFVCVCVCGTIPLTPSVTQTTR